MYNQLQGQVDSAFNSVPDIRWSVCIRDVSGNIIAKHAENEQLSTASVGKLLLLAEVARQHEVSELDLRDHLARRADLAVANSGLWQHLQVDSLSIADVAILIASASDNLATNVLLDRIGLDRVSLLASSLGLQATSLQDRVRNTRSPDHPTGLSVGSAAELSHFMGQIARRQLISDTVSDQLDLWLATGLDLSMVASPFNLDPLAHVISDRGILLRNKTGTDTGVRADVGYLSGPSGRLSYAVLVNWTAEGGDARDGALTGMRSIGQGMESLLR